MNDPEKIVDYLSPNEKKILPLLKEKSIDQICEETGLDKVAVLRTLKFLKNKNIINISTEKKDVVEIGVNGALYKKVGLPERRFLNLLGTKRIMSLEEIQKQSKLSKDEFKAALGTLKKKGIIEIKNGKVTLNSNKEEISKKMPEESLIEALPTEFSSLNQKQSEAFKSLKGRKNIIEINEQKTIDFQITNLGEKLIVLDLNKKSDSIEELTSEIIKKESWKGKKFRKYDITSNVPKVYGGKRHFVNQAIDYGRRVWTEMGFKEMSGDLLVSSFWNFDALFSAQDHPTREMQDTFFIDKESELPNKKIVKAVKQAHEKGVDKSKGWRYSWSKEEAKKMVLRTHTTCLSSQTLVKIRENKEKLPQKFFALGKTFRNETVDWSHGFEFNQTEGIVIDKNANFRHLLGYLKQFFKKMGFEKIRFRPGYFPYTEPSVEIDVFHPERKKWLELGGAGIFRPEVTIPLLGENIPVLAWGPGFDRMLMNYYELKDIRELYKNDLNQLRKIKFWMK